MPDSSDEQDDLDRPTIPLWVKVIVCALAVIGLLTIVKWIVSAVLAVVWILVIIGVLVAAAYVLRSASKRNRDTDNI